MLVIDHIDKEIVPLTYENAISEIKKKNTLIKRIWLEGSSLKFNKDNCK